MKFPPGRELKTQPHFTCLLDPKNRVLISTGPSFVSRNGFTSVHAFDQAGWSPLHYAAMLGAPLVIKGPSAIS